MRVDSVETDPHASDAELQAVANAFRDSGLPAKVSRHEPYVGAGGPDNWIIIAFLSGFFGAGGKAAFDHLAALIQRLASSRKGITDGTPSPVGRIILRHGGDELAVDITEEQLPAEAWDQLDEFVKDRDLRDRQISWDSRACEWRCDDLYRTPPDASSRRGPVRRWLCRFTR